MLRSPSLSSVSASGLSLGFFLSRSYAEGMEAPSATELAPEETAPATGAPPSSTETAFALPALEPKRDRRGNVANLKRYPKGQKPPQLTPGRVGPNRKTLDRLITEALQDRSGARLKALAMSIVQDAINGEAANRNAARTLLLPRLWPILKEQQEGQRVVFEGIRLELTPTGGAQVTLQRAEQTNTTDTLSSERDVEALPPGPDVSAEREGSH